MTAFPAPAVTRAASGATVAVSRDPAGLPVAVRIGTLVPDSADPLAVIAAVPARGAAATSTDPEPSPEPSASPEPIQVSKEVFTQTFSEVELLIKNLNGLIKARNFSGWTKFLSAEYLEKMSEPVYLRQLSQSATLQKNGIVLKSLNDYFLNVVVPSRANLRLDDLVFLSENVVEAIMVVGNRRVTVYRLIKIDNQWMIGLS